MAIPTINKEDYKRYTKQQKIFYWVFVGIIWIAVLSLFLWDAVF